jgi:predicted esterase
MKLYKPASLYQLIIVLVTFLATFSALAAQPQNPFYLVKKDLNGIPGQVINLRASKFTIDPFFNTPYSGVNAWQVLYQSENATGESIAVSGTILVPTSKWHNNQRPIIGFSVGTRGLGDSCAPSHSLSQGNDYESDAIINLLKKGWAVVITDYEGLGTPGIHTYMVGPSQGKVALDIIRAAQNLPQTGLSTDAPIILMGYSQGGAAAGWASELLSSYAPELNVVAAVLGGVPADLEATNRFSNGSLFSSFPFMSYLGLSTAYKELDLTAILNDRGYKLLEQIESFCVSGIDDLDVWFGTAFRDITDFTTLNPLDDSIWQFYMAKSKLGKTAPDIPVYLYHGIFDQMVIYSQAAKLRQEWCDIGATVEWHPSFDTHLTALNSGPKKAVDWIADRIDGIAVSGNCHR